MYLIHLVLRNFGHGNTRHFEHPLLAKLANPLWFDSISITDTSEVANPYTRAINAIVDVHDDFDVITKYLARKCIWSDVSALHMF